MKFWSYSRVENSIINSPVPSYMTYGYNRLDNYIYTYTSRNVNVYFLRLLIIFVSFYSFCLYILYSKNNKYKTNVTIVLTTFKFNSSSNRKYLNI